VTRLSITQARRLGLVPAKRKPERIPEVRKTIAYWDAKHLPNGVWIQMPEIPPSLNVYLRWHYSTRRQYLSRLIDYMTLLAWGFKLPMTPAAMVQIIYYFPDGRRRDKDNYGGKQILDALRYARLIADDNRQVLTLPEPVFEVDKERPRVEIFIKRMSDRG